MLSPKLGLACILFFCINFFQLASAEPTDKFASEPDAWRFSGQILARSEMDGRDFDSSTNPIFWTVTRTRLGVAKSFFDQHLDFFMQIQDSRTLGDLGVAIGNLQNIDLYQGYFQIHHLLDQELSLQIGRFELEYGNGRLFHPLSGWNYLGQSFDGGRLKLSLPDFYKLKADAFSLLIKNSTTAIRNPTPTAYPLEADTSQGIHGIWASAELDPAAKLDAFAYYENYQRQSKVGFSDINRWTMGINHQGSYLDGFLSSSFDVDYQRGQVSDQSVNAYLVAAAMTLHPGEFQLGAGFDLVSGNPSTSTTTNNAFGQPYGNNFVYYGTMDYFLNIPNNTQNLGLNDFYLKSSWAPAEWPIELVLQAHHFMANQTASNGFNLFGQELDLTLTYKHGNNKYIWGLSGFLPGNLFSSDLFFGSQRNQPAFWSYLQAIVNF